MNYELLFSYILAIFLFLGTPGPVTLLVINNSIKSGFKMGLSTIAGTNLASLILIALSFMVIQGLFAMSETALQWLTLFGSCYLIYFSITILKDKIELSVHNHSNYDVNYWTAFRHGFLIGIANPKDILFFIGFFPLFLSVHNEHYLSMFLLTIVWIILDYLLLSLYALFFSKLTNITFANIISKLSGMVLLIVAIYALIKTAGELF